MLSLCLSTLNFRRSRTTWFFLSVDRTVVDHVQRAGTITSLVHDLYRIDYSLVRFRPAAVLAEVQADRICHAVFAMSTRRLGISLDRILTSAAKGERDRLLAAALEIAA